MGLLPIRSRSKHSKQGTSHSPGQFALVQTSAESDAGITAQIRAPRFGTSILRITSFLEIAFYSRRESHGYLISRCSWADGWITTRSQTTGK